MTIRLPILLLAVLTTLPWMGQDALAQQRPDDGVYLRPRVGISYYLGDNNPAPFKFDWKGWDDGFPYNVGLEVGRQVSETFQFGLSLSMSKTGGINEFEDGITPIEPAPNTRWAAQLVGRHFFGTGKVSPFVSGGIGVVGGKTWDADEYLNLGNNPDREDCKALHPESCGEKTKVSPALNLGFGFDFALGRRTSFFVETGVNVASWIADIDGYEGKAFGPFDILGWHAVGFNFNLQSFVPVTVGDLVCPMGEINTGTPTRFAASVNDEATLPVSTSWNFGDGSTATGLTASHSYSRAGSYDVTFTATNGNGKGTASKVCAVTAKDPCVDAEIVSMSASTMSPDTRTAITFSSNVRGTDSKQYRWDFGDGQTATSASGSHTYAQAGTYTVKLAVTNCGGTVEKTMTVTVVPYEAAICREITEMNPVFFDANSSTLTADARAKLQENLAILKECPNLNARIVGWASPGERRSQELSADRAKAVEQFYVDNGIALSRLVTLGSGVVDGLTSEKEGDAGYRRVDTIPVRR